MEHRISIRELEETSRAMAGEIALGTMLRVPPRLLKANPESYIPLFISVGPFHHLGPNLDRFQDINILAMEGIKRKCMLKILRMAHSDNIVESLLQACWIFIRRNSRRVADCYHKEIEMNEDVLNEIMLVDGCFLLYFLLYRDQPNHETGMDSAIRRDLALLENQIPFFILEGLLRVFTSFLKDLQAKGDVNIQWLLAWRTSKLFELTLGSQQLELPRPFKSTHLLDHVCNYYIAHIDFVGSVDERSNGSTSRGINLRNATKLKERGLILKYSSEECLLNLRFADGILRIPRIVINDCTETLLTNILAHEQLSPESDGFFTSYVFFMTHLIEGKDDLQILEQEGIIINKLGSREDAGKLFSNVSKQFVIKRHFHYMTLCKTIEEYAKSRWQRHKQELKKTYSRSTWTTLSVVAATFLLILTLLQTIYSIMSYNKGKFQ